MFSELERCPLSVVGNPSPFKIGAIFCLLKLALAAPTRGSGGSAAK